jgi:carboxyl-terminal processing protease
MRNKKLQVWLPLLFSFVMIAGMFFGFRLNQQTGGGNRDFFAREGRSSLQEAMDLIRKKYVDKVKIDSLQDNAMEGLMDQLDPHSVYIPNRNIDEENESITGNFQGIGVEFNIFSDTVNVLYVMPGGPGEKAGLQIGDRIIKVNDSNIVSKTLPSDDIRHMIRGAGGTKVKLSVVRNNTIQYFYVTRATIPLPSLDATYMLDATSGYIRLNKFSETTYQEFMRALEDLQARGMKSLVLDLRGNGGGLVQQAVNIADEFIGNDELIVYTEGTNSKRRDYTATKQGVFETGKLVVLVDELTASASEILAGALQDLDRATIVGRRSFGKGLVQEQYELSDGSAIRLTVARYFTPLGRSIQRPYDKGKKVYLEEILERYRKGEVINPDSAYHGVGKAFKTKGGRTVYGGGGIMPDIYVPVDTSSFTANITKLYLDGRFNNYVYLYYMSHRNEVNAFRNPAEFSRGFVNTDSAWNGLVDFASKDNVNLHNIPAKDKSDVQSRIRAYLARLRWRTQGFYEVSNSNDPVVQKALQLIK